MFYVFDLYLELSHCFQSDHNANIDMSVCPLIQSVFFEKFQEQPGILDYNFD